MGDNLFFLNRDARILNSIRKGDEAALAELYASNWRPISSFILRNSGSLDDAKDMLQEALVVLWERVHHGTFEPTARLSTFIFATAKHKWLRQLARRKRDAPASLDEDSVVSADDSALELIISDEQAESISSALERIGEPCRSLLLMFYWEERSLESIARELGYANADTVKSKKYQCKQAMRRLMERAYHGDQ